MRLLKSKEVIDSSNMEMITEFIHSNISYAPYIIFALLMLAGIHIPVSEDAMILLTALLAVDMPEMLWPLFTGLFLGCWLSDLLCFFLWRFLGEKIQNIKFIKNSKNIHLIDKVKKYYSKYGIITLIFGRFVPFGLRNGLFMTAGIVKMNIFKFFISDLVAAILSVSTYFYLYFIFGDSIIHIVKRFNILIFIIFIAIILFFIFKKYLRRKKTL